MEVYVIRHTPVQVEKGICYGQTDVLCGPDFEKIAEQYRQQLPSDIDKVFTSPLTRCKQLAEKLDLSSIEPVPALMEMNFGEWEGVRWDDMDQEQLRRWAEDFVFINAPSGENLAELSSRVNHFMDSLRKQSFKKVLLVTHAGVIRCLWAYLLGIPLNNIFKIPVGFGEVMSFYLGIESNEDFITRTS